MRFLACKCFKTVSKHGIVLPQRWELKNLLRLLWSFYWFKQFSSQWSLNLLLSWKQLLCRSFVFIRLVKISWSFVVGFIRKEGLVVVSLTIPDWISEKTKLRLFNKLFRLITRALEKSRLAEKQTVETRSLLRTVLAWLRRILINFNSLLLIEHRLNWLEGVIEIWDIWAVFY